MMSQQELGDHMKEERIEQLDVRGKKEINIYKQLKRRMVYVLVFMENDPGR